MPNKVQRFSTCSSLIHGGEGGIRTLDTGAPYTHFPGVRLKPLGHLSLVRAIILRRVGSASSFASFLLSFYLAG